MPKRALLFLTAGVACFALAIAVLVTGHKRASDAVTQNQKFLTKVESMRDQGVIVENFALLGEVPEPDLTTHYITAAASGVAGLLLCTLALLSGRSKDASQRTNDDPEAAKHEHPGEPD